MHSERRLTLVFEYCDQVRMNLSIILEVYITLCVLDYDRSNTFCFCLCIIGLNLPHFQTLHPLLTISIRCLKFNSWLERIFCLLQKKWNICLVINSPENTQAKTSYAASSKLFINIFHAHWKIFMDYEHNREKTCMQICPWILSVPQSSKFSLSFALGKLWNR